MSAERRKLFARRVEISGFADDPAIEYRGLIRTDDGRFGVCIADCLCFFRRQSRDQFQQLNSVTVEGTMAPGSSLGAGLDFLRSKAADIV